MNLITIIPIARGIATEHLTYFSLESPALGSLVEAPLRGKSTLGLVVSVEVASTKKDQIKRLPYGMKRLSNVQTESFLLPQFMQAVQKIAEYYVASSGAVLSVLLPKNILAQIHKIRGTKLESVFLENKVSTHEKLCIQANEEDRLIEYKNIIRESFVKKQSVFIAAPTIEHLEKIAPILEKGIEAFTVILHGDMSAKNLISRWQKVIEIQHPVLIIATGYFISLPRADIGTFIVEAESKRAYHTPLRPFLDLRKCIEMYARICGAKIILGDTALRLQTLWQESQGEIHPVSHMHAHIVSQSTSQLIHVKNKKEFQIITDEAAKNIVEMYEQGKHTFLFTVRKGMSPLTICSDCGTTVTCTDCLTPLVLHDTYFMCHWCNKKYSTEVLCTNCKGWKLTPLGIASDGVLRELQKRFPEIPVFVMTGDTVKSRVQAQSLMKKFYATPGAIMIGTELALPYLAALPQSVHLAIVLSIDPYFLQPDFNMKERIFHLLTDLRMLAQEKVIVQTRMSSQNISQKIFAQALSGTVHEFFRDEMTERKRFDYPPFTICITLTCYGKKSAVKSAMQKAKELVSPFELAIFEGTHAQRGDVSALKGLIVLPQDVWPQQELIEKLRMLPPEFEIRVDPESLL